MEIKYKTIVIANTFQDFKNWCIKNNIDRKSKDRTHVFMINEYSARCIRIKEVLDIVIKHDSTTRKYKQYAEFRMRRGYSPILDL